MLENKRVYDKEPLLSLYKAYRIIMIILAGLLTVVPARQARGAAENTIAYKMAILHTRAVFPERHFLGRSTTPANATVSEFQWILDSIKYRSTNSETEIADAVYEAWNMLKQNGKDLTLLETARQLSRAAKDTRVFGADKVNFRVTSRVWATSIIAGEDMETVLQHFLSQNQQ